MVISIPAGKCHTAHLPPQGATIVGGKIAFECGNKIKCQKIMNLLQYKMYKIEISAFD